jgi:alkylation response protein AidB-like acyl-CoA dehydrogenase
MNEILREHPYLGRDELALYVLEAGRKFKEKYIIPNAHELDKKLLLQPQYHPDEIVRKGCEFRFFSLPIPKFIGGLGGGALHVSLLMEELCSGCAGIANIFGAHYLGLAGALVSGDLYIYGNFVSEVVKGERENKPVIFSAAITEPTAGTDVEERELLQRAKLVLSAKRVENGYLLNGRKVFISNGSIADYNIVVCAIDKSRPLETFSGFVVPKGTKGFSAGRIELKMGQRACHAAELVFEDCFIPEENRVGTEGDGMLAVELVLSASRGPVGAIATGIARGAYEKALEFAINKKTKSGRLIDKQWVQLTLADMDAMIRMARNAYIQASIFFDRFILNKIMRGLPQSRILGGIFKSKSFINLTKRDSFKRIWAEFIKRRIDERNLYTSFGLSSFAKFSCSDIAVKVCLMAMRILGAEGIEERNFVEKYMRDAKLTQIYEGTNQLNRWTLFKTLVKK